LALIGYFTYGTDLSLQDYLPETVAEWVGGGGESEGGSEEVEPPRP